MHRAFKYIRHILSARNTFGFRIHSPFVFHFTKFVIYEKNPFYIFPEIEALRKELKKDGRTICITDFGMGKGGERKVNNIARKSLKQPKYGQLFYRIVNYSGSKDILELGTSLGITTCYLGSASKDIRCTTLEGCPETIKVAQENFNKLQLNNNINIIQGDINKNLETALNKVEKLDFIFIDANHRSDAVLDYFEKCLSKAHDKTIVLIDDIYWSDDMEYAWNSIKSHEKVSSTIDLFQVGIAFLDPVLQKKNYKMRF
ncbi:class I SAM-dependent methyltransferase [Paludibacter sp. 221]|uniref:O-methyltransferase n=1 Tax=Paludibacter sp. 221 TaxID=2302939 RepID=UPI0013D71081|nr:class I SAM-dependent methyltransferase [Paludibacter sp. 221]NDV46341.1 class I SAM-dependent methyltransferase [Paludibacter sp. 221]